MRTFILYIVLLALFALAAAQSHIAYGGFQRLLPVVSTNVACWDATRKTWKRDDAFFLPTSATNVVPVSDTEAYFIFPNTNTANNGNSGQIMYATQASYVPVLGNKGVFTYQPIATSNIIFGTISAMVVNKARTRLWVIGTFTKIGSTSISQLTNSNTIAVFDISTSKTDPTLITIASPPTTLVSVDSSRLWTQGDTLLIYATEVTGNQNKMYRITLGTGWTAVTDASQAASTTVFRSFVGDETLFAYGSNDLLHATRSVTANPTYQRLPAGATTWSAVATNVQAVGEVTRTISVTQWVPVSSNDVVFIISGTSITGSPITNAHRDQVNRFIQYFYRASGNTLTQIDTGARLSSSTPTFSGLTSVVPGALVYDDVSKAVMFDTTASHIIRGDYQSPQIDPTSGLVVEDRSKYISKRVIGSKLLLRLDGATPAYDNFFGGMTSASTSTYFTQATGATQTCFFTGAGINSYNLFAPLIAHYNDSQWNAYPALNFDADTITGANPSVLAVERVGTTAAFFAGGSFRTIDGVVYNSLVKYNADKTISAVGNGVSDYSRNGDGQNSAGTSPSDANVVKYYDTQPGTVTALKYDSSRSLLFVAGSFIKAGSVYTRNFAQYNETSKTWSSVGKVGITGGISKMVIFNDYLIVAGTFTRAENFTANRIAMWNLKNNTWEPMGFGLASFTDMTVYNGQLFVSGQVFGRRQGAHSGTSTSPSFLNVWNPVSRTFNALSLNNVQDLGSTTCSISAVCDPTTLNNGMFFQIANGRLYLISNTNGLIYKWNGNNFDFVFQQAGASKIFIKNGITDGSRTIGFNSGTLSFVFQDSENNAGSWNFNWDRTESSISDAIFTDLVSSGFKVQFNIVLLAVVAFLGLLFA